MSEAAAEDDAAGACADAELSLPQARTTAAADTITAAADTRRSFEEII